MYSSQIVGTGPQFCSYRGQRIYNISSSTQPVIPRLSNGQDSGVGDVHSPEPMHWTKNFMELGMSGLQKKSDEEASPLTIRTIWMGRKTCMKRQLNAGKVNIASERHILLSGKGHVNAEHLLILQKANKPAKWQLPSYSAFPPSHFILQGEQIESSFLGATQGTLRTVKCRSDLVSLDLFLQ